MKKTYKEMMTRDDKQFIKHAKSALAGDFSRVMSEAKELFDKEPIQSKAKRAANAVILNALKEVGEQNWREPKEQTSKPAPKQVIPGALPPAKQGKKKWTGPSILDLADKAKESQKQRQQSI